MTSLYSSVT